MPPLQFKDERLLSLLTEQQLITSAQAARLRAQLARGLEFRDAIAKTPLVDALKLATMEAIANQPPSSKEVKKPILAPAQDLHPQRPVIETAIDDVLEVDLDSNQPAEIALGGEVYELRNLGPVAELGSDDDLDLAESAPPIIHELDPELELEPQHLSGEFSLDEELILPDSESHTNEDHILSDELDMPETSSARQHVDFSTPGDSLISDDFDFEVPQSMIQSPHVKEPRKLNTSFDAEVSAVIEHAMSGEHRLPQHKEEEYARLPALVDKETYSSPSKTVQVYNTADDEGINLIREVNDIFARVLNELGSGFIIDPRKHSNNLFIYGGSNDLESTDTIIADRIDKVANRLKVMARLEPWRRQSAQRGHFRILHDGRTVHAFLQTEPKTGDKEVLIVRLEHA